jgi:hypothetical protein
MQVGSRIESRFRAGRNEKPGKKLSAFSVPAAAGTPEADPPVFPTLPLAEYRHFTRLSSSGF